jgi:alkaline phosphatase
MEYTKRCSQAARYLVLWCIAVSVAALLFTGCAGVGDAATGSGTPKNIIILFADGTASTQWEFARYSSQYLRKRPFAVTDTVFRQGAFGLLTTHSADAMVTDSAASGTAMSTGAKTNNYMIGVTPDGKPVRTAIEAAKAAGKHTGLVTTATIFDASPAAFSVHSASRGNSQAIVDQYLALEPDVLLGGGAEYFLPAGPRGGKRKDSKDMIAAFAAKGYQVVRNTAELNAATGRRVLGLFADDDMDFEIDRDAAKEPSTAEMTAAALRALAPANPNGFVLFVENENPDTAGHRNDIAALMRALWAFDDAVQVALEFQRSNPDTLIIVTGDHETGGLSVTYALKDLSTLSSKNRFFPGGAQLDMINRITMSLEAAAEKLGKKPSPDVLDQLLAQHFPGFRLDDDLREVILKQRALERNFSYVTQIALGRMISRQTGFYWGTSGHTTEPVAVGALGPGAELFKGYQDNTDFARALQRLIERR